MTMPPVPVNENNRLQCLKELNILETPVDETFEKITRITKALFNVPIVAISLIDCERQWFKSIQGLNVCETSREVSFCAYVIVKDELFIVNDTKKDHRFSDHPAVIDDPFVRFYAGYPIKSRKGNNIGTLCIIDTKPRNFSIDELNSLIDMASLLENELYTYKQPRAQVKLLEELDELKRKSMVDQLTRLWNKPAIEDLIFKQLIISRAKNQGFSICFIDLDNFKPINDTYGHLAGDEILRSVSKVMLSSIRGADIVGRWGGEEFLLIIDHPSIEVAISVTERVRLNIENLNMAYNGVIIPTTITGGLVFISKENLHESIPSILAKADSALYKGKNNGKNKVVLYNHI